MSNLSPALSAAGLSCGVQKATCTPLPTGPACSKQLLFKAASSKQLAYTFSRSEWTECAQMQTTGIFISPNKHGKSDPLSPPLVTRIWSTALQRLNFAVDPPEHFHFTKKNHQRFWGFFFCLVVVLVFWVFFSPDAVLEQCTFLRKHEIKHIQGWQWTERTGQRKHQPAPCSPTQVITFLH